MAELFYIFTTSNLIESNDQRKFCRQRVLNCSLRVLNAEYFWLRYVKPSTDAEFINKFKEFKTELSSALVDQIRRYELVNPLEVMVFETIQELELMFDDDEVYVEKFMKDFYDKFYKMLSNMKRAMISVPK